MRPALSCCADADRRQFGPRLITSRRRHPGRGRGSTPHRRGPRRRLPEVKAWLARLQGFVAMLASRHPATATILELALVPVVAWLVLLSLGVTLWTKPFTPDTEFYFTLAAFGSDITDHAVQSAYYWTRVGVVVPLRGLISVFGVDRGYGIWHFTLIGVALVPSYDLIRRLMGRVAAIAGALFILLNLVFLTAIGNPYVTSAIVPLFIAECALLAGAATATTRRRRTVCLALVGVCVGWIVACNQLAAVSRALPRVGGTPRDPEGRAASDLRSHRWRRLGRGEYLPRPRVPRIDRVPAVQLVGDDTVLDPSAQAQRLPL